MAIAFWNHENNLLKSQHFLKNTIQSVMKKLLDALQKKKIKWFWN